MRSISAPIGSMPVPSARPWLPARPLDPLVALGRARGEPIRRAPVEGHLFVRGRRGTRGERAALDRTFDRADAAMTRAARAGEDRPAASALGPLGPFGRHVA